MANFRVVVVLLFLSLLSVTVSGSFHKIDLLRHVQRLDSRNVHTNRMPQSQSEPGDDKPSYILDNGEGVCFIADMKVSVDVTYEDKQGENKSKTIEVPKDAEYLGICEGRFFLNPIPGPLIWFVWWWDSADPLKDNPHVVMVQFNVSGAGLLMYEVFGLLNTKDPDAFPEIANSSSEIFFDAPVNDYHLADLKQSFTCNSEKEFDATNNPDVLASVKLENVRFQKGENMSAVYDQGPTCSKPTTDNDPSFILNNGKNNCFLSRMKITLTVPYETEQGETKTAIVQVPHDALYAGACEGHLYNILPGPVLTILWFRDPLKGDEIPHFLIVSFKVDNKGLHIGEVNGFLNPNDNDTFPGIAPPTGIFDLYFDVTVNDYYLTEKSESFTCESEKVFQNEISSQILQLENVEFQSGDDLSETFGPGSACAEDHITSPPT